MKEATGELSMVVVTIIAIVAILVIWNLVKTPLTEWLGEKFGGMMETGKNAEGDVTNSFNNGYHGNNNNNNNNVEVTQ